MKDRGDELIDLMDELNSHDPEDFLSGKMMHDWAQRVLTERDETEATIIAFLEHVGVTKTVRDMIARGVHRQRSSVAMAQVRGEAPKIENELEKWMSSRPTRKMATKSVGYHSQVLEGGRRR